MSIQSIYTTLEQRKLKGQIYSIQNRLCYHRKKGHVQDVQKLEEAIIKLRKKVEELKLSSLFRRVEYPSDVSNGCKDNSANNQNFSKQRFGKKQIDKDTEATQIK